MIPRQLRSFIHQLVRATGEDGVHWKEGADDAYFAVQKDANLHIRYAFDQDTGESGYNFRIMRGQGDAFFSVVSDEEDYPLMRDLYSSITVNAAGGEAIVEGLLD